HHSGHCRMFTFHGHILGFEIAAFYHGRQLLRHGGLRCYWVSRDHLNLAKRGCKCRGGVGGYDSDAFHWYFLETVLLILTLLPSSASLELTSPRAPKGSPLS